MQQLLGAADGLTLNVDPEGEWRVSWNGAQDWTGPLGVALHGKAIAIRAAERFDGADDLGEFDGLHVASDVELPVRLSVRAYRARPLLVFRLEARVDLEDAALGAPSAERFERPWIAWPRLEPARRSPGGVPEGTRGYGHAYSEFALPTFADASLSNFFLIPQPRRPALVQPLWLNSPADGSVMLAPLDAFHEQVIAVPRGHANAHEGVSCGWHGDLDSVPAGFASELALWAGPSPRGLLDDHCGLLLRRHETERPSRYADPMVAKLSYWTDNGAAYWYRTAPGLDLPTTLERTLDGLREQRVPFCAVELDSWFYPHEHTRSVNPEGVEIVPPSGMMAWEAREDVIPEGVAALRARLGNPPLVLHSRHFSSKSPYFEDLEAWTDADRAHPVGPELFDRLMAQAEAWGAVQYEQDWLVESFLGVRGLRERPGRARAWQETLDRAAERHGQTLLWCMATPADFFQTLTLRHVTAIRTSGDYRYIIGNAALWCWFLYGNALARALGLNTFKDVFLSSAQGRGLDGDPCAEVEALLSALSAGPVGLGDRMNRTDPGLVSRTCRPDGLLVKPDAPIAALDRCFVQHAHTHEIPMVAETFSQHGGARWHYVVALHAWREERDLDVHVALSDLGAGAPREPVLAYDWRSGQMQVLEPHEGWSLRLAPRDWDYRVLAPILPGGIAVVGDPERYATAGDRRLRNVRSTTDGVGFDVLGAPGEHVRIRGWSRAPLRSARGDLAHDASTGHWEISCEIGDRGWEPVRLIGGAA